jgi:hypothetical protein
MEQLASLLCWKALYLFMVVLATLPHRKSRSRSSYQYFPVEYSYRRNGHCGVLFREEKTNDIQFLVSFIVLQLVLERVKHLTAGSHRSMAQLNLCCVYRARAALVPMVSLSYTIDRGV